MSGKNQNSLIIAVAIIIISFTLIMFGPLLIENGQFNLKNEYTVILVFSFGFMVMIFIFIVIAIKQRRNIYG